MLALVLCCYMYYWAAEPFICWLTLPACSFSFWMKNEHSRELVCHITHMDYILLMRAKIDSSKRVRKDKCSFQIVGLTRTIVWPKILGWHRYRLTIETGCHREKYKNYLIYRFSFESRYWNRRHRLNRSPATSILRFRRKESTSSNQGGRPYESIRRFGIFAKATNNRYCPSG